MMVCDRGGPVLEWDRLLGEFRCFETDTEMATFESSGFVRSLLDPPQPFVETFLEVKLQQGMDRASAVRALYFFLLQKRYDERLNLLHFTFSIFDEDGTVPREIVDRTPFPHEEGVPGFRHCADPDFLLTP